MRAVGLLLVLVGCAWTPTEPSRIGRGDLVRIRTHHGHDDVLRVVSVSPDGVLIGRDSSYHLSEVAWLEKRRFSGRVALEVLGVFVVGTLQLTLEALVQMGGQSLLTLAFTAF
jgi:hypothetical protein